jgi:Secretion system C-terminal sorting domain/GEVED domain
MKSKIVSLIVVLILVFINFSIAQYCLPTTPAVTPNLLLYPNSCILGSNNYISNVSIQGTGFNNTSGCSSNIIGAPSVNVIAPSAGTTASLQQGMTYTLSVTTSDSSIVSVWIDYNHNFVFESIEWTQVAIVSTDNIPSTVSITIPYSALPGTTGMRIRSRDDQLPNYAGDACSVNWLSGELEQYTITVLAAPQCSAPPVAGTTISTRDTVCSTTPFKLSLSGASIAQGLSWQWEKSINGSTWTPIIGANNFNYTTVQSTQTYYHCLVSCNGTSSVSAPLLVRMLPTEYYSFNGGTIFSENFDNWMDGCDNHDIPSINWLNIPATGDESWRRHDEGFSTANWGFPSTTNLMTPFLGAGAARFHSYSAFNLPGVLDLYLNCSSFSSIKLDFYYLKKIVFTPISKFEISVSTNGGFTFGPPIATYTTANTGWLNKVIDSVLVWNSPTCIIRFKDFGDWGSSFDTGIDELRIDGILGVSNADNDNSAISLSPNPSNGSIEIRCSNKNFNKTQVQLMDVTGRIVATERFENGDIRWSQTIDWSNQTKGIYVVKLISETKVYTQKIILE